MLSWVRASALILDGLQERPIAFQELLQALVHAGECLSKNGLRNIFQVVVLLVVEMVVVEIVVLFKTR